MAAESNMTLKALRADAVRQSSFAPGWRRSSRAAVRLQEDMSVNESSAAHLDSLARLLRELAEERIELLTHSYRPQAFGSFEVILGRGHDLLKFTWDGRESILSVSFAKVQNKNASPAWTHDADFSLPNGDGVYSEIASQSVDMLAI
jgi:hypothetical protein